MTNPLISPAPPSGKPISTISSLIYPVEDAESRDRAIADLQTPDPTREQAEHVTAILKGKSLKGANLKGDPPEGKKEGRR